MRKKFTVKKIVLLSILVLMLLGIGVVANAVNGNPISKALAKYEYKRYVKETYPNNDFKVSKASYNFKDGNYGAEVISESKKLKFWLSKRYDDVINDEYRDQPTLSDSNTSFRFREAIKNEIMKEIEDVNSINLREVIYVDMIFPQGKYDENSNFTRDIDEEFKIQVSLSRAKNNDKVSNDEIEEDKVITEIAEEKEIKEETSKNKEGSVINKVFLLGKKDTKEVAPNPVKDKEIENIEKIVIVDEEFIDSAYRIKEIIINMGYTGLNEIEFEFEDKDFNHEYILLNKEQFNTTKDELVNFKVETTSMYEKGGQEEIFSTLAEEIRGTLKNIKNIEDIHVYDNILGGSTGNITGNLKILKEVRPTKEELAKEAFEIKELIKKQHSGIKYLEINFYEYGELNAKGGNWGQYYGSIFIGNEFAPWEITEEEINTKLKVWDEL